MKGGTALKQRISAEIPSKEARPLLSIGQLMSLTKDLAGEAELNAVMRAMSKPVAKGPNGEEWFISPTEYCDFLFESVKGVL